MANYVGRCWKIDCGGKSGVWDSEGNLVGSGDGEHESLLLAKYAEAGWSEFEIARM